MEVKAGYKQTEVGVIPEDWEVTPVGEAYEICNNLRLPISRTVRKQMEGPYPYYGPTSIQGYINEYRVEGEYALIGEDGDHFLKWREQSMTLLVRGRFNVNNHAHLIRGTKNLTTWFYYYFAHRDITQLLTRQGAGRFKLNKRTLIEIPCALPLRSEQEAIIEALSDADALIEALEQLLAKKRQVKQGAMQELLTGKKRVVESGKWEVKSFGELVTVRNQKVDPRKIAEPLFCVELEHIDQGTGRLIGSTETSNTSSIKTVFKKGDVLFGKLRAYLRKYWLADRDGVCTTEIWALVANPQITTKEYLFQLVQMDGFIEAASMAYGTHMPRTDWNVVRKYEFLIPNISEQTAIAEILSDMDAEITALEGKLSKAREVKAGMMSVLLTGRIRLVESGKPE